MKQITVIGTGYVGLVTGACLAEMGNHVICLDIDQEKIQFLQSGHLPFYEPGLEELVHRNTKSHRLKFTSRYEYAIPGCEICFLALPTPSNRDDSCDISYVENAAKEVGKHLEKYAVIVNKSTVPVGTANQVKKQIQSVSTVDFDIVSNPEFLREGSAVSDAMKPDRIILGVESEKAFRIMRELYEPFSIHHDRILIMDIASSELSKYAANAMLASRISLMNQLAELCEHLNANIKDIRIALGLDERIGYHYLNPGIGFGGSCLPKDVKALRAIHKEKNLSTSLFDSILDVNEHQKNRFFEKVLNYFDHLSGKTLAIWGLSFKPDTDDLREAPALHLIQKFLQHGASLKLYDPAAMEKAKEVLSHFEKVEFCSDEYEAAENADAIVLVTEWKLFQNVDFEKIGKSLKNKVLFDGRNQYSQIEMQKLGFDYFCIGKPHKQAYSYAL